MWSYRVFENFKLFKDCSDCNYKIFVFILLMILVWKSVWERSFELVIKSLK